MDEKTFTLNEIKDLAGGVWQTKQRVGQCIGIADRTSVRLPEALRAQAALRQQRAAQLMSEAVRLQMAALKIELAVEDGMATSLGIWEVFNNAATKAMERVGLSEAVITYVIEEMNDEFGGVVDLDREEYLDVLRAVLVEIQRPDDEITKVVEIFNQILDSASEEG